MSTEAKCNRDTVPYLTRARVQNFTSAATVRIPHRFSHSASSTKSRVNVENLLTGSESRSDETATKKSRLRAVPFDELVNGVPVAALRVD
jgi:hypothetical protein